MATGDTYVTKRIPFVGSPEQRTGSSGAKDQLFINFYPSPMKSVEGTKYYLEQRAGLVYLQSSATGTSRGVYYWNTSIFVVIGNTLYRNGNSLQVLSTSTGKVGFQEFAAGTTKYLIVLDGTSGWVIDTSYTVTQITDADFPTPHCTQCAYIDGYLVVAKANTDDLYNSNIEDPLTWTTGDFITAEMFPDAVVGVVRQNNYIVAIGTATVEYFYDAGNSPGTPFARNSAAQHQIGTPAADTIVSTDEKIIFVGQTQVGGRSIWLFTGFDAVDIGEEVVRQSLDNEGSSISNAKAFVVRSKGHSFYVLNLTSVTWVYDMETKIWHQWADYTGTAKFNCDYASDYNTGKPLLVDRSTGYVYVLTEGVSKDATGTSSTANINSIAISDKHDFGTMNAKFMHRFSLVCDVPNGSNSTSGTLYWTDDDYQNYSTGRTITISDTMPTIVQLGRFRRRAFKFVWAQAYPIRIEGFEVDINLGAQ